MASGKVINKEKNKETDMIILPDIHGRTFWKDVVYDAVKNTGEEVVFLGDYHDPYSHENISTNQSLDNFKEIIDLKKKYPEQITLLLGNHDCGYIWDSVCESRRDRYHYKELHKLFTDNFDLFDLAYREGRYLLTHSGVHKEWYDLVFKPDNQLIYNKLVDNLNNWLHADAYDKEGPLGMYSRYRGWGGYKNSSPIWGDVREWMDNSGSLEENRELGYYQIFGHTQLENDPIIAKDFACLDNRRPYRLVGDTLTDIENKKDYILNEVS